MKIQKFDVIVGLYIFAIVVAQLMGLKVVPFGEVAGITLSISVAIFVMPLLFTLTDIVVEVYGKERARSMVWTGLGIVVLLALYTFLVTTLPPAARFAEMNGAYNMIFGTSIQFAIAAIAAFASAELIDVLIYSKLREKMKSKGMWLRNNVSNFIGQLIDSTVFCVIAFYSFSTSFSDNFSFLIGIIIPYWLVRCLVSIIGTPLAYAGVAWLRKRAAKSAA
ncbi:MAG TPA: queuosine precursor transporter [Candidatus Saccharimonadales bacterium]